MSTERARRMLDTYIMGRESSTLRSYQSSFRKLMGICQSINRSVFGLRCSGLVDQHMAVGDGLDNGFESQFVSICPCGDGLANGFKSRWVSICPL